jgi:hypothetical protein
MWDSLLLAIALQDFADTLATLTISYLHIEDIPLKTFRSLFFLLGLAHTFQINLREELFVTTDE